MLAALEDHSALAPISFFEVAPENYMRRGGYFPAMLHRVAEHFPLLSHGLTLSVGGADPLDGAYLAELARFLRKYDPAIHSDHLCFTGVLGLQTHDLLPLPFTREAVRHTASRIRAASRFLGRPIAVENITYYLVPGEREMDEATFLNEVVEQADCGLLLDVNNVFVNAKNHGDYEPMELVEKLPLHRVVALHVAGHERRDRLLIDTHGADVEAPVYDLVEQVIARVGELPVVVERDHAIPPFDELLAEVRRVSDAYERGRAAFDRRRAL